MKGPLVERTKLPLFIIRYHLATVSCHLPSTVDVTLPSTPGGGTPYLKVTSMFRLLDLKFQLMVRGVAALIPSVLGGFVKILGDLTSYIGNWEVYEKSWVITPIMLGIGGFEENHG